MIFSNLKMLFPPPPCFPKDRVSWQEVWAEGQDSSLMARLARQDVVDTPSPKAIKIGRKRARM